MIHSTKEHDTLHFPLQAYFDQLIPLFRQARESRNPALFLYRHKARTTLFMVESLLRLLSRTHVGDNTDHALKAIKKLEDRLGKIDDYDQWAKQFSKTRSLKKEQRDYFKDKRSQQLQKLNKNLKQYGFYLEIFQQFSFAFPVNFSDAVFVKQLQREMRQELNTAYAFYAEYPLAFTDINSQVHELRRMLRWLSIYAQSLQGLVVLKPDLRPVPWKKAFTPNALSAKYNKVVARKGLRHHLVFHQQAFYAFNTIIYELGEIKDKGLALEAFAKMLRKTCRPMDPEKLAEKRLKGFGTMPGLLKEAHVLLEKFFIRYRLHQKLV